MRRKGPAPTRSLALCSNPLFNSSSSATCSPISRRSSLGSHAAAICHCIGALIALYCLWSSIYGAFFRRSLVPPACSSRLSFLKGSTFSGSRNCHPENGFDLRGLFFRCACICSLVIC